MSIVAANFRVTASSAYSPHPPKNSINPGHPDQYINLKCFTFPKAHELGFVGRNALRGPGLEDFDFSIFKNTNAGEKLKVQFRAEFFNILNRPNFEFRMARIFDKNGQTLPVSAVAGPPTVGTSRQLQFGLKFMF